MTRSRLLIIAMLVAIVLIAGSVVTHQMAERNLTGDWRRLQSEALIAGFGLDGQPAGRSGWPLAADLAIDRPNLAMSPDGVSAAPKLLLLRRSPFEPGRLRLTLSGPVAIVVGSRRWQVWGDRIEATVRRSGVVAINVSSLRVAVGQEPDDILTLAKAMGIASGEQGGRIRLSLGLQRIVMPFPHATASQRVMGSARLEAKIADQPGRRSLTIDDADFEWNGMAVHLAGALATDQAGTFSGRLSVTLGPGWRDWLAQAVTARIVTPAEAQAAIGLISLVAPGGTARDLPLAVQNGRVTFAGLLLLTPNDLAPKKSAIP